jgi:hypothetical protein
VIWYSNLYFGIKILSAKKYGIEIFRPIFKVKNNNLLRALGTTADYVKSEYFTDGVKLGVIPKLFLTLTISSRSGIRAGS